MELVIYNQEKTNLSPISFVNDLKNQTKIRSLDANSKEFKNQLGLLFAKINNLIGIKQEIEIFNKKDIKEMILMRFKSLSLEEVDYAFKLERYGTFGKRIDHFQLFNAEYVGKVLERYLEWKVFQMKNVVKKVIDKEKLSEQELQKKNKEVLLRFINEYEYTRKVEDFQFYIYDILDNIGLMPTDVEYKNQIKKEAILILEKEYSNRKANSKDEFKRFQRELEQVKLGKGGAVKKKCKVLVIDEFFKKIYKDPEKIIDIKNKIQSFK